MVTEGSTTLRANPKDVTDRTHRDQGRDGPGTQRQRFPHESLTQVWDLLGKRLAQDTYLDTREIQ